MLLRCARCRAVYEFETAGAHSPVVRCARCSLVFAPRPALDLVSRGQVGGAAAWPHDARPRPVASIRNTGMARGRRVGLLSAGGALAVLAVLTMRVTIGSQPSAQDGVAMTRPLPPSSQALVDRAVELLRQDDLVSLESAVATFSDAAALAPQSPEPIAWRSVATSLLAGSYRAEAEDLLTELRRPQAEQGGARVAKATAGFVTSSRRHDDLRARLAVVVRRAQVLSAAASELAGQAEFLARGDEPEVRRALALARFASGDIEGFRTITAGPTDPWIDCARGWLVGSTGSLYAAKAAEPRMLRATWGLARLSLEGGSAQRQEAARLFSEIVAASPRHEGARRGQADLAGP